jgi:hypothetical protein
VDPTTQAPIAVKVSWNRRRLIHWPEKGKMQLDDPFPLDELSQSVRAVILGEFQGRHPTVRQVSNIPDRQWLRVPGIGPGTLMKLRHLAVKERP